MQTTAIRSSLNGHARLPASLGCGLLLCLALFVNFMLMGGHDHQRLVELATVLIGAGIVLVACPSVLVGMFAGPAGKVLAAFFALGIFGATAAFSPRLAAFEVANLFLLYLLASAIATEIARRGQRAMRLILGCMGVACAMYACLFFGTYLGSIGLGKSLALEDFTPNFSNIRFFNHAQTLTLPLLVLLCCSTPRASKLGKLWLAVTAYWWMALLATNGRGTLVGIAAASVVVAVLARRRARQYLRTMALTVVLGLLAYGVFLVAIPAMLGIPGINAVAYVVDRTTADPTSGRTVLWHQAMAMAAQHPWLGVGPMHFAHQEGVVHTCAHPHNWVFQIAAEWGLPALLCLLIAIGLGLRALLRAGGRIAAGDTDNEATFAALLAGAVAVLVDGLVSGIVVMPQSELTVALHLGCALGWYRAVAPGSAPAAPQRMSRVIMTIGVVVAMMAVIVAVQADVPTAWRGGDVLTPAQEAANPGTLLSPRLWKAGFF